jgi:hypothetical protein
MASVRYIVDLDKAVVFYRDNLEERHPGFRAAD